VLRSAGIAAILLVSSCGSSPEGTDAVFRWGADQEGGGPFISPRQDDPTKVEGFEVDLAGALAERMGRRALFVQCNWDQMLPLLTRGNIDLAINGYEYTPERSARYRASLPYYVYELGLCARRDDPEVRGWDSLELARSGRGRKRIGVLGASAADRYVTERFGGTCDVVRYEGSTEALQLVETGQLDATVQDLPVLHYYVDRLHRFPGLAVVDRPAAPGYYVAYARPEDDRLIAEMDEAIRALYRTGALRAIYERYGIWNARQETLPEVWTRWDAGEEGGAVRTHSAAEADPERKWVDLGRQVPLLLKAAGVTIALSVLSMPLAIVLGLGAALARGWSTPALGGSPAEERHGLRWVRRISTLYVEIVRGTPLAFQLWVVYFVVPLLLDRALPGSGLRIDEFWSGVIALAINYSAYEAEIFRLGLQAVPSGQVEAALSLGMRRPLALRRILLPQAVRIVIPATANDFIALFKDTAVCSVIAVEELSKQYSMGAKSTGLFLEMAVLTSVLYLVMSYPLSLLASWLERRLK
jgi:polar amino acid transport system substrate-binding protein